MEVIQSYIITTARYDFSVYEKRVLYRLVELIQFQLAGKKLNQRYRVDRLLYDLFEVEIPLKAFLKNDHDTDHARIKKALKDLSKKMIEYEDNEEWRAIPLILLPKIRKNESTVKFRLHEDIYNAFLNFTKGFKKYELKTAMEFESVYAMRLYELFSKQRTPLIYSIKELKAMFGVENKYKLTADFIKRVIETAQTELNEKSPHSFEYSALKTGKKITSIKFYPTFIAANVNDEVYRKELQRQIAPSWAIEQHVRQYLKEHYNFSTREMQNNLDLLEQATKEIPDLLLFLSEVKAKANRANNPKGYLINAIKKKLSPKC